jgi:deoxyribose-phosphate aldolase
MSEFYVEQDRELTKKDIAHLIDHTNLKPEATFDDIKKLCDEAKQYGFYSVCVNSFFVPFAKEQLKDSSVKIASVVGFPLGAVDTAAKTFEAERAIRNGADEIDMVINIGALKSKDYRTVEEDIRSVVKAVSPHIVKVIIETCLLSDTEKIIACTIAASAGAQYVKTSTGFNKAGAKVEDVKLMRSVVGKNVGVKAAGGIHTFEEAVAMVKAGASRIGASRSVAIVT